jgi:hypothetical protein
MRGTMNIVWTKIYDEFGTSEQCSFAGYNLEVFRSWENDYWECGFNDDPDFIGEFDTIEEAKQEAIREVKNRLAVN